MSNRRDPNAPMEFRIRRAESSIDMNESASDCDGKPLQKLRHHWVPMPKVIEEVLDRNPGPGEARRSAHNLGIYADGIHWGIIARSRHFFPNAYNLSPVLT